MKRSILAALILLMVFSLGVSLSYAQGMGPGMMGPGYGPPPRGDWNYCPYCGNYVGPDRDYDYNMGPGMMGRGYGYGMGPGMMGRGYGMGPGMMGRGYGMGPGMMGRGYGYGMGPGMMGPEHGYGYGYGYGPQSRQPQKPLDKEQAQNEVEDYLQSTRNPNLKIGKMEDKGNYFEAEITTKDGSLVDRILVDKDTGAMRSAY